MTANELLWSTDGRVRLEIKSGMTCLTINGVLGGGELEGVVKSFPALNPETILNAPAKIQDPVDGYTRVVIDMDEVKKELKRRKKIK